VLARRSLQNSDVFYDILNLYYYGPSLGIASTVYAASQGSGYILIIDATPAGDQALKAQT